MINFILLYGHYFNNDTVSLDRELYSKHYLANGSRKPVVFNDDYAIKGSLITPRAISENEISEILRDFEW